jgi:putative ABC transport system ATP-binding protein
MNNYEKQGFGAEEGPGAAILRTAHLSKVYDDGQVNALCDVSLEIHRGEYVAIMGPSGSGKSTLLNMLGALDRPTSGEVFLDGIPISAVRNLDRLRAEKIGFVFQSFYLLPVLSAMENVQVPMFESNIPLAARPKKAVELLEIVGLGHRINHQPQKLSVGERQRVAIARALANDPILLLADEPTGNLDSRSADDVFNLFARLHAEQGMTIVLITHSDELGQRAKRIVRMQDGRLRSDTRCAAANGGHGDLAALSGIGHGGRIRSVLPPFAVPDR